MKQFLVAGSLAASALSLSGCASWSREAKGTAIGVSVGAAARGIIGHEVGKEEKKR